MSQIGAPGDGPSRRDFLKATGTGGLAAAAGCAAPSGRQDETSQQAAMQDSPSLPYTSPPEIVDVDEQGGRVTLSSRPAKHAVHPTDTSDGRPFRRTLLLLTNTTASGDRPVAVRVAVGREFP